MLEGSGRLRGRGEGKIVLQKGFPQFVLEGFVALLDAFPDQDFPGCPEDQGNIQQEGNAAHVKYVVAQAAAEGNSVASVDLSHAGDARPDGIALAAIMRRKGFHLGGNPGAGAYDDHVSFQDVDQLRKLIQRIGAEEVAEREQSLVVRKEAPIFVTRIRHRFEFDDFEQFSLISNARLKKEGGFSRE